MLHKIDYQMIKKGIQPEYVFLGYLDMSFDTFFAMCLSNRTLIYIYIYTLIYIYIYRIPYRIPNRIPYRISVQTFGIL